ncbi:hypothetical protein [Pseudomonas mandelii]|uniref:hypothetical protein n=1 Tax=Pseudomonas mandelii TaxID=75612 RepID=UPI0020A13681|nr:hypothetical protein [Pseudomonas mandelii]MCO8311516.1 hypothetical protein [Pseudomonas mandelii]
MPEVSEGEGSGNYSNLQNAINHCGSGLARDEGLTVNIFIDCYAAIAGKPAPTGFM